ncbi:5530_t:CDS:10, partial [Diversispora eburnea]
GSHKFASPEVDSLIQEIIGKQCNILFWLICEKVNLEDDRLLARDHLGHGVLLPLVLLAKWPDSDFQWILLGSGSLNPVFPRPVNPEGTQAEGVLYEALKTVASENNTKARKFNERSETRRVESILKEKEDQEACQIKSNVLDEHIIESNLVLKRKQQKRKHADKEGECSTRELRNISPVDYNENLNETNLSESDHEEKVISTGVNYDIWINIKRPLCKFRQESYKRKQSESNVESDYEPSSSPTSSDSGHDQKKKQKISERKQPKSKVHGRNYCSSTDNPSPVIMMTGGDVASLPPLSSLLIPSLPLSLLPPLGSLNSIPNNVIISQDLPTSVNQYQLSTLTVTNPIIQTPGTPPPRPNVNNMQVTPQKSALFKESVTYLQNHIKIDVNDQGMIIKDNHTSEEISSIIRNWLIMALTSPKEEFVNAIMTPLSSEASPKDHDFRQICEFILYDFYFMTKKGPLKRDIVELDCMREVKKIFPKFDLPINQADGLGVRNSSNKEVVFIEILGGPENKDQKKLKEDSEKLLKEAVFGLVSLLRNYLDKSAEESKQLYTFIIQGIAVFEFLYILVSELEIQTRVINKLRLSESADGVIVPRIRDWIWLPDSISAWECEEIQNENL